MNPGETDPPDKSYRSLFRQPSLTRVVSAMQLGRTAGYMLPIVLILYALTVYDSPALAGLLTLLSLLPGLIGAPVIGALLDRFGRIRLIALDYLVAAAGVLLLGVIAIGEQVPVPALIGVTFVLGITQMFSDSGLRSLFPRLAPAELWERVNAVDSTGYQIGMIVGPPLAATVFAVFGPAWALLVIAALYAGAALSLRGAREPAGPPPEEIRLVDATLEGMRYVLMNRTLRALAASVSTTMVAVGMFAILLPVILLDIVHAPEVFVGGAYSLAGILGILAAVILGRMNTLGRERTLMIAAEAATTVSLLLLLPATTAALAIGVAWVLGAAALYGFAGGVWDVSVFTVRQRRTEPRLMGRAFAISMALNSSGYPIGAALGGWLASQSIELAIAVAVGFGIVGTLLGWLLMPREEIVVPSFSTQGP